MRYVIGAMLCSAFVLLSVVGLYLPFAGHADHETGCPFGYGVVLCDGSTRHLEHWKAAVLSIIAQVLVLLFGAFFVYGYDRTGDGLQSVRYRLALRPPTVQTLFQRLYSRGIHNRMEPCAHCYA